MREQGFAVCVGVGTGVFVFVFGHCVFSLVAWFSPHSRTHGLCTCLVELACQWLAPLGNDNHSFHVFVRAVVQEGTRILEDQLRLMDEKYIDLRGKLDWARTQSQRTVTKILAQTSKLETKWAALQSTGALQETRAGRAPGQAWE